VAVLASVSDLAIGFHIRRVCASQRLALTPIAWLLLSLFDALAAALLAAALPLAPRRCFNSLLLDAGAEGGASSLATALLAAAAASERGFELLLDLSEAALFARVDGIVVVLGAGTHKRAKSAARQQATNDAM
jgi:hypothetical protein